MISIFNGRKRTLGGATSKVYAQTDVNFREYLHYFKGAKLHVFLAICLHANENGWAWPSVSLLAKETGYSPDTINAALKELCALTIHGERLLLKFQPKHKESGQFHSNHYLIFPSTDEVEEYKGKGLYNTVNNLPSMEKPVTEEPPDKEKPSLEPEPTKHGAIAPPADLPTEKQEPMSGEETLEEFFGPRDRPVGNPIEVTGDWLAHYKAQPHMLWGNESAEVQAQVKRYGNAADPVLKLGYELDRSLGLRPTWGNRKKVKAWLSGLVSCLEEGDWKMVVAAAKQMREAELTIKDPWSIVGMVSAAAAEKRSRGRRITVG